MGKRYVPKTYKNRRALRIFLGVVVTVAVAAVVLFLLLFFILKSYWVDGHWELPWLANSTETGFAARGMVL